MRASTSATKYRWVVCGLLFCALVVLYVDRQILGLLKPMLDEQFGKMPGAFGIESLKWSNTTFGLINSVFLLALQPWLMRFSRSLWLSFFVPYDPDWEHTAPAEPERTNEEQKNNW